MNRFAALLDRLAYEGGRNNKLRLLTDYFRTTADPDRGYALAAITGGLSFRHAKPGLIRDLIAERTDPTLFALSYDYVGDLSETVALMWPGRERDRPLLRLHRRAWEGARPVARIPGGDPFPASPPLAAERQEEPAVATHAPTLAEVVTTLAALGKTDLPAQLSEWLDGLDEVGRWALLKLVTGALRIG